MKVYLEKIGPHFCDMIYHPKKFGEWKMYLTMKLEFMSSTNSDGKRTTYSKSASSIIMIGNDADEIVQ